MLIVVLSITPNIYSFKGIFIIWEMKSSSSQILVNKVYSLPVIFK